MRANKYINIELKIINYLLKQIKRPLICWYRFANHNISRVIKLVGAGRQRYSYLFSNSIH